MYVSGCLSPIPPCPHHMQHMVHLYQPYLFADFNNLSKIIIFGQPLYGGECLASVPLLDTDMYQAVSVPLPPPRMIHLYQPYLFADFNNLFKIIICRQPLYSGECFTSVPLLDTDMYQAVFTTRSTIYMYQAVSAPSPPPPAPTTCNTWYIYTSLTFLQTLTIFLRS